MSRQGSWERRIWEDLSDVYEPERGALKVVHDNESGFGEFLTVSRTPIIELNSSYGTSILRDVTTTLNGATITKGAGEIILSTGTNANGEVTIASGEVGRYIPGFSAEIGVGARLEGDPVGTQSMRIGGRSPIDNNAFYWGKDSGGWFVEIFRSGGSSIKKYRADWNLDPVDGTGTSGFDIENLNGHIFQIDFTWYGYGRVKWYIIGRTSMGTQIPIPVHEEAGFAQTSITSPNLRVYAEAKNGGTTASDLKVYLGGRQYSIVGTYRPKYRVTSQTTPLRTVGTSRLPLVSFRGKSSFADRSLKLEGQSLIVEGNVNVNYQIVLNGTLTGASWGTPTNHMASETALESDRVATQIAGGHVLFADIALKAGNNKTALTQSLLNVDIPDGQVVSLCAFTDTGTTSVKSAFRLREEW